MKYRVSMFFLLISFFSSMVFSNDGIVIAHRGACGYLPEHTLEAKALAYGMGADYIEQDLVMTGDGNLIVLHDYLESVTNVEDLFPERKRSDGHYYSGDFTLEEIKSLNMIPRFKKVNGEYVSSMKGRFDRFGCDFKINTFEEEIEMIQGLNYATGKNVGIYPEIKAPAIHKSFGIDISKAVLKVLKKYGYDSVDDKVYLQCFDEEELKKIKNELFPEMGMEVKLVQLISSGNSPWIFREDGMEKVAEYACGIGPSHTLLVDKNSAKGNLKIMDMVERAKKAGLVIHPYTFRKEAVYLPKYANSFDELLDVFYNVVGVDGVFTDFPDLVVEFLK